MFISEDTLDYLVWLDLAHRDLDNDGLPVDSRNLMIDDDFGNLGSVDIDLVQLRAIQGAAIY